MPIWMVYSEAGGVTKTTSAVSLAMSSAVQGRKTTLIDLDPRGAATKWIGAYPEESWKHVGAILADVNPEGWVEDLAVGSEWHSLLRVVPSSRALSNREKEHDDHAELRLTTALQGHSAEVTVIDCPNRQGGLLIQNALAAAEHVIYAATANQDGIDGVEGARESVARFQASRIRIGAATKLQELGIIVGGVKDTIMTKVASHALKTLAATDLVLDPIIPNRTVVDQARMTGQWYGNYDKGEPVAAAYDKIFNACINSCVK
ncbi:ATPase involved in chromosome partitioning [Mycobacteroides abscessus subsp. abscessus]|uniref:ParA family protein n=2 Tax=Mycobacteroides abscessus TaxID=36809 RepID=UPI000928951E|nr:ParA family protein [Mycobacteroides abscessus]SHQ67201.1 ATPase involved in chromosome partitioning [Mycobacteroides abscessus subsp. abscessus]SHR91443.1 ATPase involved in chromosome partitioning [Mycobacteroides abscessus subsp. abscessus]SIH64532.1 ATPase involved in chromosome partitioning [Mycobacteroides abscessus subsp. abscessus]